MSPKNEYVSNEKVKTFDIYTKTKKSRVDQNASLIETHKSKLNKFNSVLN